MFTGIIEEIGKIAAINTIPGGKKLKIFASKILDNLKVDNSVSVNGICLTATRLEKDGFFCEAVGATLEKTTLNFLSTGEEVNLERAMRLNDRLGGHLVQGHVNGVGIIKQVTKLGDNYLIEIYIPGELIKYLVDEGSIAIDGISLTIAKLEGETVSISVIPHTWNNTVIKNKKPGSKVNIETDVLAKYVEKLLLNPGKENDRFSDTWFKKLGY